MSGCKNLLSRTKELLKIEQIEWLVYSRENEIQPTPELSFIAVKINDRFI